MNWSWVSASIFFIPILLSCQEREMAAQTFNDLCLLPYKDQAIFFMNGYWGDVVTPENASHFWDMVHKFVELENKSPNGKGAAGSILSFLLFFL